MSITDDPRVKYLEETVAQNQHDIALLVSIIALQALSPRRTPKGLADLIDRAGGGSDHYKASIVKEMADIIRGGSLRPVLTLIKGGAPSVDKE